MNTAIKKDKLIVCAGEALVEFVSIKKNFKHDHIAEYAGPFPSGAPAIFIDQASRMGSKTQLIGSIGNDGFGRCLSERLQKNNVGITNLKTDYDNSTGVAFVAYQDDGSRDFIFHINNTAAVNFNMNKEILNQQNIVFHVSGASLGNDQMREYIKASVDVVRSNQGIITFDPNVRAELFKNPEIRNVIYDFIHKSQCFLPSTSDLSFLYPDKNEVDAIEEVQKIGVEVIALKKGSQGATIIRGEEKYEFQGHQVEEVDPTGAGDCFCGTFVSLFYQGLSLHEAGKFANAAGALAVTKIGPMEGNTHLDQIKKFLQES